MQLEPQLPACFLRKLLAQHNYVDDLRAFDTELYAQLMAVKHDEPDEADTINVVVMALTFSMTIYGLGSKQAPGAATSGRLQAQLRWASWTRKSGGRGTWRDGEMPVWLSRRWLTVQLCAQLYTLCVITVHPIGLLDTPWSVNCIRLAVQLYAFTHIALAIIRRNWTLN